MVVLPAGVEAGPARLPSRALVVDDSMVVADVVTALLRRTGWTVDVANTVDAALEHVRGVPDRAERVAQLVA